jgi:hypothetical protein
MKTKVIERKDLNIMDPLDYFGVQPSFAVPVAAVPAKASAAVRAVAPGVHAALAERKRVEDELARKAQERELKARQKQQKREMKARQREQRSVYTSD